MIMTTTKEKNLWTDAGIHRLQPTKGDIDHVVWHPKVDRFGVRFIGGKPVSYTMMYYLGGRDRKRSVGKFGQVALSVAIEEAKSDFAGLAKEIPVDPALARQQARDVHSDRLINFVVSFLNAQKALGLSDSYLDTQTAHLLGTTDKRSGVVKPAYFAALHDTPIKLINRRLVSEQLDIITAERGQIAMTRARATLSKFFTWLGRRHIADINPVQGTERFDSEGEDRSLTVDELVTVWRAAAANPEWQFGRILRLLILTAGRRDQIGKLTKKELCLEATALTPVRQDDTVTTVVPGMITLPRKASLRSRKRADANGAPVARRKGGSKNGGEFKIPLSRQAVKLIEQERMHKPVHVFGDDAAINSGFSGWSKTMPKLYALIGDKITDHWTLHDIRRTFVTLAVEVLGADPTVADACINHKPEEMKKGVRGIYQQAELLKLRAELMIKWGDYIEQITKPDLRAVA